MHYSPMGETGFEVSDIILGTYKAGATDWGAVNDLDSVATIKYCVDRGMDLIDTATGYGMGRAERLINYALSDEGGKRLGKTKVMTKWSLWQGRDEEKTRSVSPEAQAEFLIGSKARLGVEKLDIVLMHRDDEVTPIETAIETLARYQSEGHIDWIGASNYCLEHLERAQKVAPMQMYQPHMSMFSTEVRDDGRLAFCQEHGIAVGVFRTFEGGWFAPRLKDGSEYPSWDPRHKGHSGPEFEKRKLVHSRLQEIAGQHDMSVSQLAIAWALSQPGVTSVVMGASTPEQAEHNLAASGKRFSKDVADECERIVKSGME